MLRRPGSNLEVLYTCSEPNDTGDDPETFPLVAIRFGAEHCGFTFDARCLTARLPSADPRLHEVVVQQAERMLAELAPEAPLVDRASSAIAAEFLAGQKPKVRNVAACLDMTPRTLQRKLE